MRDRDSFTPPEIGPKKFGEPVDPVAADPVRQVNDKINNIHMYIIYTHICPEIQY